MPYTALIATDSASTQPHVSRYDCVLADAVAITAVCGSMQHLLSTIATCFHKNDGDTQVMIAKKVLHAFSYSTDRATDLHAYNCSVIHAIATCCDMHDGDKWRVTTAQYAKHAARHSLQHL